MREILFRGKTDKGEWVYGNYCGAEYLTSEGIEHLIIEVPRNGRSAKVIPETVGQYTGLIDKNGQKIFEGHIIKKGFEVFVVKWNAEQCRFDLYTDKNNIQCGFNVFSQKYFEIIGNITDNPELLGGE